MKLALKAVVGLVLFGLVAALIAGCNTMAGLGKDVEKLGTKIERKAKN